MTAHSFRLFLTNYFGAIIWALSIAFLSLTASSNLPQLDWALVTPDKFGHFIVYAILNFLLLLSYKKQTNVFQLSSTIYLWHTVGCILYGFIMEWAQFWLTKDRCFEYPDMIANGIGAVLGFGLMLLWMRFATTQHK